MVGRAYDSGGGLQAGRNDIPIHATERVQKGRLLGVADETGRTAGDKAGGLRSWHKQAQCLQRVSYGGTDAHRTLDGPGGAPRRISTAELHLLTDEYTFSN